MENFPRRLKLMKPISNDMQGDLMDYTGVLLLQKKQVRPEKAASYFEQLKAAAQGSDSKRSTIASAELIFKQNI
jgi:hypothetical protein